MRSLTAIFFVLLSGVVAAETTPRRFVPWSPLTEEEITREKARMPAAAGADLNDKMLRNPWMYHRYRERDIVAAYPELRGSKKLSSCWNSMMTGATQMIFVSHIGEHEVTTKTLNCTGASEGALCGDVKTRDNYFLKSPLDPIELDGVSLAAAPVIVETYQAHRVDQLPEWFQGHFPTLKYIKALADGQYTLIFGDYYCAGCSFRYDARLDTSGEQPRLVVTGNADGGCY